jgi:hypothetical protein
MANTFDTSRVGGGTYELEQDASGNYNLKSVGFTQVNKLNLPDLKTSEPIKSTTMPVKTPDVADPFKKLAAQNTSSSGGGGGGSNQDYSGVMLKTPEVKDVSVRNVLDPRDGRSPTDIQNLQTAQQDYNLYNTDRAALSSKYPDRAVNEVFKTANNTIMDARQNYGATTQYNTPKTTGLQKVQSAVQNTVSDVVDSVKNNKALQMAGTILGVPLSPLMTGAKMVAGSLTNEYQKDISNANKNALTSLGYKTNYELGNMSDPGRVAGNPAKDVFAGMNAVSAFGDISKGAQKRLDTRNSAKTQERMAKKSQEAQDKFNKTTADMQKQKDDHDKASAKDKANAQAAKAEKQKATQGPAGSGGGGGGGGGRVICTDLHRTGELSTRDWIRDTKFTFKTLSITHVKGYLLWAEPTVKHIQKYPRYRKVWKHIAQHRANDIAWRLNEGKFDLLGRIYAGIGEPLCWALGNFVSNKQINKYNLTHWRRA